MTAIHIGYTEYNHHDANYDGYLVELADSAMICTNPKVSERDTLLISLEPNQIEFLVPANDETGEVDFFQEIKPKVQFFLKLNDIRDEARDYRQIVSLQTIDGGMSAAFNADQARTGIHMILAFRVLEKLREHGFEIETELSRNIFCRSLITAWFTQIGRCEAAGLTKHHPVIGSFKTFIPTYRPLESM